MIKKVFDLFDKKKFLLMFRLIVVLFVLVLGVNLVSVAYSKYESGAKSKAISSVALFIVDEGSITKSLSLTGLVPSDNTYEYDIYVANYQNNDKANVNMEYTLDFKTTTNLPLTYDVIDKETGKSILSSTDTIKDVDGVYYLKLNSTNTYSFSYKNKESKEFTISVKFPSTYINNYKEYQSLIDLFTITVNAKQVV